jgi:trk system potassium uptake protein TrkA
MKRRFVIIGLGHFGFNVARVLFEEGHEVVAIDQSAELIQDIKDLVSRAYVADATDKATLEALKINEADVAVVSLGLKVDASVLVTMYLHEMGIPEIIVKALSDDHASILERVGATSVVHVEKEMAIKTAKALVTPNILEHIPLTPGYSIAEIAPPPSFIGKSLKELKLISRYRVQVIAIKEFIPERMLMIPPMDTVIKDSDLLIMMGKDEDIRKIEEVG